MIATKLMCQRINMTRTSFSKTNERSFDIKTETLDNVVSQMNFENEKIHIPNVILEDSLTITNKPRGPPMNIE